jgi:hypothetical protein
MKLHDLPTRLATGGYILHSGLDKWKADDATAAAVHGMAVGTYPMLKSLPPNRFTRLLAAGEIAPPSPGSQARSWVSTSAHRGSASPAACGPPTRASASARTSGCSASASVSSPAPAAAQRPSALTPPPSPV